MSILEISYNNIPCIPPSHYIHTVGYGLLNSLLLGLTGINRWGGGGGGGVKLEYF